MMAESSIDGAVLVTGKIKPGNLVTYGAYMVEPKAGQDPTDRVLSIINDMGPETPAGLMQSVIEMDQILGRTRRANHGDDIVISFSPKRFNPRNPAHVAEAREIVAETLRRGAPNSPHLGVLQGDNGVLHAHIALPNYDVVTGKARRVGWHHQYWRDINDAVLREHGIEPIVPGQARQSEVERIAAARGAVVPGHDELIGKRPQEITSRELDSYLAAHVNEAVIDGRLATVPDPGESVLLPIGDGLSLSVRRGTKGGMSYAVTDADGTPAMTAPGKRGGKPQAIARSAGKLDRAHHTAADGDEKLYGQLWLAAQIAAMSAEEEMEDVREDERRREGAALEDAARAELDRAAQYTAGTGEVAGTGPGEPAAELGTGEAVGSGLGGSADDPRARRDADEVRPDAAEGAERAEPVSGRLRGAAAQEVRLVEEVEDDDPAELLGGLGKDAQPTMRMPFDRQGAVDKMRVGLHDGLRRTPVRDREHGLLDLVVERAQRRYDRSDSMTSAEAVRAALDEPLRDGRTARQIAARKAHQLYPKGIPKQTVGQRRAAAQARMREAQRNLAAADAASRRKSQNRGYSMGM